MVSSSPVQADSEWSLVLKACDLVLRSQDDEKELKGLEGALERLNETYDGLRNEPLADILTDIEGFLRKEA